MWSTKKGDSTSDLAWEDRDDWCSTGRHRRLPPRLDRRRRLWIVIHSVASNCGSVKTDVNNDDNFSLTGDCLVQWFRLAIHRSSGELERVSKSRRWANLCCSRRRPRFCSRLDEMSQTASYGVRRQSSREEGVEVSGASFCSSSSESTARAQNLPPRLAALVEITGSAMAATYSLLLESPLDLGTKLTAIDLGKPRHSTMSTRKFLVF